MPQITRNTIAKNKKDLDKKNTRTGEPVLVFIQYFWKGGTFRI